MPDLQLTGRGEADEPLLALRQALAAVGRDLAQAGAGPHHLTRMIWEAPEPALLHPSRRAVDLAYREAFGGFRPPVALRQGRAGVTVKAQARPEPPPPGQWGGYELAQLARQYTPRSQVPNMGAVFADMEARSRAFREATSRAALDLAYGPTPAERLDLYRPDHVERPPLFVFLHGGYWQAATKDQHAGYAQGLLRAGFAVAMVEYGFLPEVRLATIVAQTRAALSFLVREADNLGVDAGRLHIGGHSAGGHLAAMAVLDRDGPPIRSALLLSGLFELEPLAMLPVGRLLSLDLAELEALSPIRHQPPPGVRVGVAVGGLESDEFKRQSRALAAAWGAPAAVVVPNRNHFDLLDELVEGELLDLTLTLAGEAGLAASVASPGSAA